MQWCQVKDSGKAGAGAKGLSGQRRPEPAPGRGTRRARLPHMGSWGGWTDRLAHEAGAGKPRQRGKFVR